MKLGILSSYYPRQRFDSQVNHRIYADRHSYSHVFNGGPERDPRKYFHKVQTLLRYMDLFDWIYWLDDDAYFTQFDKKLTDWIDSNPDREFIICKSPSNKPIEPGHDAPLFTRFTSCAFLLKCTPRAKLFLQKSMVTNLDALHRNWPAEWGLFTNGDQDAFVFLSHVDPTFGENFLALLDHTEFNCRDYEYRNRLDEHFLVHFTGTPETKIAIKADFCQRVNCNKFLVPENLLSQYHVVPDDSLT